MANPTKLQLQQKVKDLKEEVKTLKEAYRTLDENFVTSQGLLSDERALNERLEDVCAEMQHELQKQDSTEKKTMRVHLHGGIVKELLK